jgi:putative ABC transport system ATP-binding protein
MIQLDDIVKTYNTNEAPVYALRDVNLHISEGEFAAIMGPSGSGKSTLLSIIGAMNAPSQGRMIFDDIDVYSLTTERRADFRHEYLGFMFQQLQLLPYLTALENVLLGLVIARMRRADKEQRARQVLEQVGLGGKEHRLPSQLSGGEQGRVAVARALVNEPPLILADEPTGNLDSATGHQILRLLQELHAAGHTVLMVTHDLDAASYAGRIVRIMDGRLVEGSDNLDVSPCNTPGQLVVEDTV